jgi:hypothetical protein
MPLFIDTHNGTELPDEIRNLVQKRIGTGEKDDHGVIDRGVLIDHESNTMHCILEGPDRNAIHPPEKRIRRFSDITPSQRL